VDSSLDQIVQPFILPLAQPPRRRHDKHESIFSIASVSSYGVVLNPGSKDPFDYGSYALPTRPSSDDMSFSMSMSVDDYLRLHAPRFPPQTR